MSLILKFMLLFVLTSFLTSHQILGDHAKIQAQEAAQAAVDFKVNPVAADEDKQEEDTSVVMNDLLDELDKPVIVVVSDMENESKGSKNPTPSGITEDLRDTVVVKVEENDKKEESLQEAARTEAPEFSTSDKTENKPKKENLSGLGDKVDEEKVNSDSTLEEPEPSQNDLQKKIDRKVLLEKLRKRLEKDAVYQMILRRRRKIALRIRLEAAKQMMEESEKKIEEAEKEEVHELNDVKDDVPSTDTTESEIIAIPEKIEDDQVDKLEKKQIEEQTATTKESEKAETRDEGETTETTDSKEVEPKSEVVEEKEQKPIEDTDDLIADEEVRKSKEEAAAKSTVVTPEVTEKSKKAEKDEASADENVKLEVDSIQSFEEWKKAQMQERSGSDPAESNGNGQRAIRTKKTQVNYASQDCGSKILGSNREAEHVSAVLEENKDLYMLNPCSANIWFVVELCEPIQVRQLQLANFELFSSAPRLFDVHISERYPAREWRHLSSFEARNTRVLQTFETEREEMMFAKYIKFEMKSHFGNEHFCPISIVRVLGISMMEEYEAGEQDESKPPHHEDGEVIATSHDANDNHHSGENEQGDDNKNGGINGLLSKVLNVVENILGNGKAEGGAHTSNNSTNTTTNMSEEEEETSTKVEESDDMNETTVVAQSEMNRSEEIDESKNKEQAPIVTMISTGDEESDRLIVIPSTTPPLHPLRFLSHTYNQGGPTSLLSTQICWFLEYIYRASIKRCVVSPHFNQTSCSDVFAHAVLPDPSSASSLGNTTAASLATAVADGDDQHSRDDDDADPSSSSTMMTNKDNWSAATGSTINETASPSGEKKEQTADVSKEVALIVPPVDDVTPSEKGGEKEENGVEAGPSLITPDDRRRGGSVAPNPIENNRVPIDLEPSASPPPPAPSSSQQQQQPSNAVADDDNNPQQPVVTSQQQNNNGADKKSDSHGGEKKPVEDEAKRQQQQQTETKKDTNITSSPPTTVNKVEHKAEVPTNVITGSIQESRPAKDTTEEHQQQPPQVINPGLNQKESVLMRLSNRIRALEKNMSLSSAYLEDLSQRYKRQMDEMQRAFNRTTTRLALGARKAEENEERQQNAIDRVQRETAELREMFQEMLSSMEYLNSQMISRHLCLMAIELFIISLFLYTCAFSRRKRSDRQVKLLEEKINDMQEYLLTEATKNAKPSSRLYRSKSNAETLASCSRDGRNFQDDDDDERGNTSSAISRNHSSPDLVNSAKSEGNKEEKSTKTTSETKTQSVSNSTRKNAKQRGGGSKSRGSNKQTPVKTANSNTIRSRRGGKTKRMASTATIASPERAVQMMQDSSGIYHHTNLTVKSNTSIMSRKSKAAAQRLIYNNNNNPDLKSAGLCDEKSSYGSWLGGHYRGILSGKAR